MTDMQVAPELLRREIDRAIRTLTLAQQYGYGFAVHLPMDGPKFGNLEAHPPKNHEGVMKKEKWTVVLLRPDYIADCYGQDTFVAFVSADCKKSFKPAIEAAQKQACSVDKADEVGIENEEDYMAIGIFAGHQECLYWGWMA